MGFDSRGLDSYNTVPERIREFREKHPDGCLQPLDPAQPYKIETIEGPTGPQTFIVYAAAAYRTPDDQRPGIGIAWEPFPGTTPYTRGSELMNAETSAWGRALVATLAASTNKGIASADEIRNRSEEREQQDNAGGGWPAVRQPAGPRVSDEQRDTMGVLFDQLGQGSDDQQAARLAFIDWALKQERGTCRNVGLLTADQAQVVIDALATRAAAAVSNAADPDYSPPVGAGVAQPGDDEEVAGVIPVSSPPAGEPVILPDGRTDWAIQAIPGEPVINPGQRARMFGLFEKKGMGGDANRDVQLAFIDEALARPVGTTPHRNHLSARQADIVISALNRVVRMAHEPTGVGG